MRGKKMSREEHNKNHLNMIKTLQRDCQHSDEIEGKLESQNNIYKLLTREERIYPENYIKKNSQEYDKIPLERL